MLLDGMHGEFTLEFMNWIATRSLEGGIHWERKAHLITAVISESVQVQFLTAPSTEGGDVWHLLTISAPSGREVYRVSQSAAAIDDVNVRPIVDKLFLAATTVSWIN